MTTGKINKGRIWHACIDCGKERWIQIRRGKPVSLRCCSCTRKNAWKLGKMKSPKGEANPNWKGGIVKSRGYVLIHKPEHPRTNKDNYVKRAILVLEEKLGRPLLPGMQSHHKNEIKGDDGPENLEELTRSEHQALHRQRERSIRYQQHAGTYDRNQHIKELRQYGFTLASIGKRYNLSRQRIEQIINNPFDNKLPRLYLTHQNEHRGGLIRRLIAKVARLFHTDISIGG